MWYAIDLFTNEKYGPYDTEIAALTANLGLPVTVRYITSKRKVKK